MLRIRAVMVAQDSGIDGFIAWKVSSPDLVSRIDSLRVLTSKNGRV
jgi:hypothetical protein